MEEGPENCLLRKPLLSHHKCQAALTSQMSPHFAKNQALKAYHVLNLTKSRESWTHGLEPGHDQTRFYGVTNLQATCGHSLLGLTPNLLLVVKY